MTGTERIGLERTRGALRLAFATARGSTAAVETYQSGALRVRFPRPESGAPLEAVLINTAGGLTGGDRLELSVKVGPGSVAAVTTQACEKIYRSVAGETRIKAEIAVAARGRFEWLPQPGILFDGARLCRETNVDLDADASLLLLESCVLGRTAMGEVMQEGSIVDRWRIRRAGRLVYADTVALRGPIAQRFGQAWALGSHKAYASLIFVAPDAEQRLDEMRALLKDGACEAAASAWNGLLAVRVMTMDGYALNTGLCHILKTFRRAPMPRLWGI